MFKFTKTILVTLLAITLFSIIVITAKAEEVQAGQPAYIDESGKTVALTEDLDALYAIKIPPGHIFYWLKLDIEDLQELLSFDAVKKAILKQEHLKNRIDELKYEVYLNGNKNTATLLQKIQEKRLEVEEHIDNSNLRCGQDSADFACADTIKKVLQSETNKNIEVLNSLLNNPRMPESSKKGLQNAINRSGMKQELKANMVQGSYKVSSSAMTMLPFRTANLYEPSEKTWYSMIISRDSVTISANKLSQPDVTLYPTRGQMKEFTSIASNINRNGLGWKDVGRITRLWYNINKEVN